MNKSFVNVFRTLGISLVFCCVFQPVAAQDSNGKALYLDQKKMQELETESAGRREGRLIPVEQSGLPLDQLPVSKSRKAPEDKSKKEEIN